MASRSSSDRKIVEEEKIVEHDNVQMLVSGMLASTGYALAPVSTSEKVLYISSISAADDLTQRQLSNFPYFIRTGWSSSQPTHAIGKWAREQGYKKVVSIAADYAFGYEQQGGFQKAFED